MKKKVFISLLILIIGFISNGQTMLKITPIKMKIFYIGVNNPLTINVNGVPNDKLIVTFTPEFKGNITYKSEDEYVVNVSSMGGCKINVSINENGQNKIIGSEDFYIKTIPDPEAFLFNMKGGNISKQLISNAQNLDIKLMDFDWETHYKVLSFSMTFLKENQFTTEVSDSDKITKEMKEKIKNLEINQKILIDDILIIGPDNKKRKISPIVFTIN